MKNSFTIFSFKLIILLMIAFSIHILVLYFLNLPLLNDMILESYIINAVLAIAIFAVLFKLRKKFANQLGFLFLGGSLLKFVVFFLVFYPYYTKDNDLSSLEFSAFFIPYLLCLSFETYSLVKWLNKID